MLKVLGMGALAAVAALVLGFGIVGNTPTAKADVTDVVDVNCSLLVNAIDGNTLDAPTDADVELACEDTPTPADLVALATAIGDKDGALEPTDFADIDGLDGNQLSTDCTVAGTTVAEWLVGLGCTNVIFAFLDDERPVTLDLPSGLASIESGGPTDFVCNDVSVPTDLDCDDTPATDGDGVVVFHVLEATTGGASRGTEAVVRVRQEDTENDSVTILVVGSPNNVELQLVESLIETSGSQTNVNACKANTDVTDAIAPPNTTLAIATATDQDDTVLTMVPVVLTIQPPADVNAIAAFGTGDPSVDITGGTFFTVNPNDPSVSGGPTLPVSAYQVICGGRGPGETTIRAKINVGDPPLRSSEDILVQDLTVGGAPDSVQLSAVASTIKCDGSETSTVTATVTDADGNNVADGVPVNFSVVALGTANPINTVTTDGKATSVITPLSNASAGVTVIVTAGDSSIADVVQTSVRVDCALPLATQPTLGPSQPTGPITPPDTGNGGYLGQDGAGFPMWTLIALALGSLTLVAGGVVARRAAK